MADFKRDRYVEKRLRAARPQPSAQLMRSLAPRHAPRRRQFALAGALTAVLVIVLSAVGGVSYAANAVNHAVKAAKRVVVPHHVQAPLAISSGGDQYRPGYGFGDKNHNHTGPPGLSGGGAGSGEKAPPAQVKKVGKGTVVTSTFGSDEQAALYFSVLDPDGKPLLLTQQGSKIGSNVTGKQTKSIHFVMLVPRTVPFSLRVPSNLLEPGKTYEIRIIAIDPEGNKSTVLIPFTA